MSLALKSSLFGISGLRAESVCVSLRLGERSEQEPGRDLVGAPVRVFDWLRASPIQKTNNHNFAPRILNTSFSLVNSEPKRAKTASFYTTPLLLVLVVKPVW